MWRLHFALALLISSLWLGCQTPDPSSTSGAPQPTNRPDAAAQTPAPISGFDQSIGPASGLRSFLVRGVIRELPQGGQTIVVRHEEIPGFMPKMTMEFTVRDTNQLRGLEVGEAISFRVQATDQESWIDNLQRAPDTAPAPPPADPPPASLLQLVRLNPGDPLPDAQFLAEDGRPICLSDFKGKSVALTFIFTRCPLPDFCPRMNRHFSRARDLLERRPDGPANWQFLSISFDPEFDRPGVLTRYAFHYRGASADRWLFASAAEDVMAALATHLDFRFASEGGTFLHNLRTVVIDPQGRLYRQFDGNQWKPEELADALQNASRLAP